MPENKELSAEIKLTKQIVATRLLMLRTESGKSTIEVSEGTGISVGAINNYERGKRPPDLVSLFQFAQYYKVSIEWLLGRTDSRR